MEIKVVNFKSAPRNNPFAPEWNYFIFESKINNVDFKKLATFLLKKEKEVLKLFPTIKKNKFSDGYTGLGEKSTTARHDRYNVLKWNNIELKKLKNIIVTFHNLILNNLKLPVVNKLYIQCWMNVMRKGETIKPHLHSVIPGCYLGGHICVQVNNTSTHYINPINQINDPEIYSSKNNVGNITMFQNNIPHYTDTQNEDKERITIAFDLSLHKNNENYIQLI